MDSTSQNSLARFLKQCIAMINECQNNRVIVDLMNNDGDRYYAWKFTNLYYYGTIWYHIKGFGRQSAA